MSDARRWLAHVCTHPGCYHAELDGTCNHKLYLCFRLDIHPEPAPLRPLYLIVDELQPDEAEAREIRERVTDGHWRRPSQHFAPTGPRGLERLTDPLPDEDWAGWPEAVAS